MQQVLEDFRRDDETLKKMYGEAFTPNNNGASENAGHRDGESRKQRRERERKEAKARKRETVAA